MTEITDKGERMDHQVSYVLWDDHGAFVARCLDVEVASDGTTEDAAVAHLQEALSLYFAGRGDALAELPVRAYRLGQLTLRCLPS
jgi:predicted RNase H-like HicB family nuclease